MLILSKARCHVWTDCPVFGFYQRIPFITSRITASIHTGNTKKLKEKCGQVLLNSSWIHKLTKPLHDEQKRSNYKQLSDFHNSAVITDVKTNKTCDHWCQVIYHCPNVLTSLTSHFISFAGRAKCTGFCPSRAYVYNHCPSAVNYTKRWHNSCDT